MSDRTPDTNEWQLAESPWPMEGKQIYLLFFFSFLGGLGGTHRKQCGECSGNSGGTAPEASVCVL